MTTPNLCYPTRVSIACRHIKSLVLNGKIIAGKIHKAPLHLLNYEVLEVDAANASESTVIENNRSPLRMICKKHQYIFDTKLRYINTWKTSKFCVHCHSKKTLNTIESVRSSLINAQRAWVLDEQIHPISHTDKTHIVKYSDRLALRCQLDAVDSDAKCNKVTYHKLGNIKTYIKNGAHIFCQGACDSKAKGKRTRISKDDIEQQLAINRAENWQFVDGQTYTTKAKKYWFEHTCSMQIFRSAGTVIEYPSRNDCHASTIADCPACSNHSPHQLIDNNVKVLAHFIEIKSDANIVLRAKKVPQSDHEKIELTCNIHQHKFKVSLAQFLGQKFFGCAKCVNDNATKKTAFKLNIAQAVVAKRNFKLINNPESFVKNAQIVDEHNQLFSSESILEFLREYPASSHDFTKNRYREELETPKEGTAYSDDEIAFLKQNVGTGLTHYDLAKKLGRSVPSVKQQCRRQNLFNNTSEQDIRHYNINDDAFSKISRESCYFAGIIATDGCIKDDKRFSIELSVADEDTLIKFLSFLQCTANLHYRDMKITQGRNVYVSLHLTSAKIVSDLYTHYNITSNKTFSISPPKFCDLQHTKAFMVGILDGDGYIKKSTDGSINEISFCTASSEMMQWYQQELFNIFEKEFSITRNGKNKNLLNMRLNGVEAQMFYNLLLTNFRGGMSRKWGQ